MMQTGCAVLLRLASEGQTFLVFGSPRQTRCSCISPVYSCSHGFDCIRYYVTAHAYRHQTHYADALGAAYILVRRLCLLYAVQHALQGAELLG